MIITYVWDADYPWDIRADKVCTTLVEAGHEVHIACRNLARKPLRDEYHGAQIHRLPYLPRWAGRLNAVASFPAYFSPLWVRHIERVARESRSELIIARDLPMAPAAIRVARRLGIPSILDMAECYPELIRCAWQFEGRSLVNYFVRNPKLADRVERRVLRDIDHVWVMVEESRDRLLRMGVPAAKVTIVSNTPVAPRFLPPAARKSGDPLRLVYVGLLNPSRGLDTALDAVARYAQEDRDVELVVIGTGKAEKALHEQARRLGIADRVRFLGWVDNAKVPALLAQADVGVVPHHKCTHWDTTIPNKLFDYMAAGIPVLVSNATPMKRIVEETGCGLVYDDYDLAGFAAAIRAFRDPARRRAMAQKGMDAVAGRYNWSHETKALLSSLDAVA